jgi:hypothetical protein
MKNPEIKSHVRRGHDAAEDDPKPPKDKGKMPNRGEPQMRSAAFSHPALVAVQ